MVIISISLKMIDAYTEVTEPRVPRAQVVVNISNVYGRHHHMVNRWGIFVSEITTSMLRSSH